MTKSLLKDPFFCGVVALQLAAFWLIYGVGWGDSFPLEAISDVWHAARFEVGHPLPSLAVYDQSGRRQPLLAEGNGTKAILIKSTCSCDDNIVSNWIETVSTSGEAPTLVLPFQREEGLKVQRELQWSGRTLRVRPGELQRFGLSGNKNLPVLVRVDGNGLVLG
jgi:hypothetical protein